MHQPHTLTATVAALLACLFLVNAAFAAGTDARPAFAAAHASRDEARAVEASRLAGPQWARAEALLAQAEQRLERGDDAGADARATAASEAFGAAALQAVQATVLTAARSKVVELDTAGAARLAPKTASRARELLAAATAELATDRKGRAAAERLAAEAVDNARRALAIAAYLRAARDADQTTEDLVLAWSGSLQRAASAAGASVDLATGPGVASDSLVTQLQALSNTSREQAEELAQRGRQLTALEEEIRELDDRLASAGSQARELGERLEARERVLEQFARLERAFPPGEATVLRQGGDIIVRLQGLVFPSGSAKLPKSSAKLLEALGEVVNIYPRASYSIEGHTDSSGDSVANQKLSQARADAVRTHMTGRLQVPAGRVSAIGYGDSRPIASNDTTEGRRENRRIDLVIDAGESDSP